VRTVANGMLNVCTNAAMNGHLDVFKWARVNGCGWDELGDEEVCSYAASNGHLDMLKWARANECPWSYETIRLARISNHDDIVEWALANGCPER